MFDALLGFFFCFEVTLVSSTSLRIVLDSIATFYKIFCYLWLFTISSHSLLGFSSNPLIGWYVGDFKILFQSIVTQVFRTLLELSFIWLLRYRPAHFRVLQGPSLEIYISVALSLRITLHSFVMSVSGTLLGFTFNRLLCWYLGCFKNFLSFDCYISIWCCSCIPFHWIETLRIAL